MTTDPTSDVLERVAWVLAGHMFDRAGDPDHIVWAKITDIHRERARNAARAAIAAMPTIERLSAERMQLREAVEPFASIYPGTPDFDDETTRVYPFKVGDLRRARAALSNTAENG